MALAGVPWGVTGASHSADIARMLAYATTGGQTGIARPGDMKVTQTATPSNVVNVAPGGATLLSRYPSAQGQSYTIRNETQTAVTVSAAPAGATLTRYLIAYVEDPQYGGAAPANVQNGPYVKLGLVSSITNILYPFIPLARIDQPQSTATVTTAMITDLRRLGLLLSHVEVPMTQGFANAALSLTTGFMIWPGFSPSVFVPEWANRAKVIVTVSGAKQADGPTFGNMYTRFCGIDSQHMAFDLNTTTSAGNVASAPPLMDRWDNAIAAGLRGTNQTIQLYARRNVAAADPGYLNADAFTQVIFQVFFGQVVE